MDIQKLNEELECYSCFRSCFTTQTQKGWMLYITFEDHFTSVITDLLEKTFDVKMNFRSICTNQNKLTIVFEVEENGC